MIQQMFAIWSLVPLPFLNLAGTSGSSRFTYCWSLAWKFFSLTLLVCKMSAIVHCTLWHCLSLGLEWKLTFSSPAATAEFCIFCSDVDKFTSQVLQSSEMSGYVCIVDSAALLPVPEMWTAKHFGKTERQLSQKSGILYLVLPQPFMSFPGGSDGKESACNAGDQGLIPG